MSEQIEHTLEAGIFHSRWLLAAGAILFWLDRQPCVATGEVFARIVASDHRSFSHQ